LKSTAATERADVEGNSTGGRTPSGEKATSVLG
jgi:hypothetical protein